MDNSTVHIKVSFHILYSQEYRKCLIPDCGSDTQSASWWPPSYHLQEFSKDRSWCVDIIRCQPGIQPKLYHRLVGWTLLPPKCTSLIISVAWNQLSNAFSLDSMTYRPDLNLFYIQLVWDPPRWSSQENLQPLLLPASPWFEISLVFTSWLKTDTP